MPAPQASYAPLLVAGGVRDWAVRSPGRLAVGEGARKLTYAQLVKRIDRVGNGVADGLGLEPGQHSAIMAPNCLEYVELLVGLASVGVAPALVNAGAMPDELAYVCNDSGARVLFVHASLEEVARAAELEAVERIVVVGGDYEEWLNKARATRPEVNREERDTSWIPYTSGTTGTLKGVVLSHRSKVLLYLAAAAEYGCFTPEDRHLAVAPLHHGIGCDRALCSIFLGGSCTIAPMFHPERVLGLIEEHRITNTIMVPTHVKVLLALGEDSWRRHDASSLRVLVSGGSPLAPAAKERIVDRFGESVLFEDYGATEVGVISTLRPADQLRKQHSVGRPFVATTVKLVDEDEAVVPPGELGELHVRSPIMFDSYLNRPEETARALRHGFYATGDLARIDEEGYIYLRDRKHDTIISAGLNVHPREVEEILVRHPAVAEAAAFGVPDDHLGEAIRAVVTLRSAQEVEPEALLDFCAVHLAQHKRPQFIELRESLPKNAAGKILRRDLSEPFWAGDERRIS